MKLKQRMYLVTAVVALGFVWGGCKKSASSSYSKDEPITGSRSDPPVTMQAVWGNSNRHVFRLDHITSADQPRRNSSDPIQRETTFGEDFALTVTNVAPDGSRILELQVLALQMDMAVGDRVTAAFDSGNESLDLNGSPLAARLQKLIGARLALYLSPENKVTRIDGLKALNDRVGNNNNPRNNARGLNGVADRYFTQPFLRDLLELSVLPSQPVRVGESWTVTRDTALGPTGGRISMELNYTFKGWQQHENRRCARLEFNGTIKPGAPITNKPGMMRNIGPGPNAGPGPGPGPGFENGTVSGATWFDPEISLPVETVMDQSVVSKGMMAVRRARVVNGTNVVSGTNISFGTNRPPETNPPPQSFTSTTRQHTSLKLVEFVAGSK